MHSTTTPGTRYFKHLTGITYRSTVGRVTAALAFGIVSIIVCIPSLFADTDQPGSDEQPSRFEPEAYADGWLTSDRDDDGTVDYAVEIDDNGNKLREAMDFNFDGRMDDFYFYANDVLQRQELDSNFDQVIDIWIYMWRGVYVRKWERDTDYDGVVDIVRDYDASE